MNWLFTKRGHKYNAQRTTVDGIAFQSKKEANRYVELSLLEKAGQIERLQRQVPFVLHGRNGSAVCKYLADFTYAENGKAIAEDVKGMKTAEYKIKRKLFIAEYGQAFEHREV